MVLDECPFCHRPFAARQISREQVDSSIFGKESDYGPVVVGATSLGTPVFQEGVTFERVAWNPEAFITYELGYRCKHCGKEWTKLSVREVGLPENYVRDEEEKTDYDASKEEEEAREDEYVEEQE